MVSLPQTWPYRKDSVLHVNRASLRSVIREAERRLGMPHNVHNPDLEYLPENPDDTIQTRLAFGAYTNNGRFRLARKTAESTVFHESVHYLMDRAGMLFAKKLRGVHERLVDELIAETAVMEAYDFAIDSIIPPELLTERDIEELAKRYNGGLPEVRTGVRSIRMHREVEKSFDPDTIGKELEGFYKFFDTMSGEAQEAFYALLAQYTGGRTLTAGITTHELFSFIREGCERGFNPGTIYFSLTENLRGKGN